MDEDFGPLSDVHADVKKLGGGLEVSLLRDYVEELERKQLVIVEQSNKTKEENEQRAKDQADVYYYLNKKLDDNYELIHSLEEQIMREQSEREVSEKEYEKTIEQLNAKFSAEEVKYKMRITDLEDKVETIREFIEQKTNLEAKLKELSDTLDAERLDNQKKLEEMEKRTLLDKRNLKKEFDYDLEAIKSQHKLEFDSKLSAKAKRAKLLTTMYKNELSYQVIFAFAVYIPDI